MSEDAPNSAVPGEGGPQPGEGDPQPGQAQQPGAAEQPKLAPPKDAPQQQSPALSSAYLPQQPIQLMPPPGKEKSFGRGFGMGAGLGLGLSLSFIVLGIIVSVVAALIFGGIVAAVGPASADTARSRVETMWGPTSGPASDTIRAISVTGTITGDASSGIGLSASTSGYEVANIIDSLKTEDGKAVVLMMNTPGGTINGSKAIGDAVTRYRERTGQKVFAYVRGMSASGGMYAMASADEIIADNGTLVGSIGVVFGPFSRYKDVVATSGTLLESGVTTTGGITQESLTQGKGKDFGNPYRDMTAEERAVITNGLANEYADFVEWVSTKRKIPADTIRNELGAYVFDAKSAKEKKLVDQVMGPDEAYRHMADAAGIAPDKMRIVRPARPGTLTKLFGAEDRIYGQIQALAADKSKVTSALCIGAPQALAVHGSLSEYCG